MNKRDLQQAIADVRSQYEGKTDIELMQCHAGFDLLLSKLTEAEAQEKQTKISAKAQTKEVKNFMEQSKMNDKIKILAKSDKFEPINFALRAASICLLTADLTAIMVCQSASEIKLAVEATGMSYHSVVNTYFSV